ncbi:hypothetical protein AYI69_g2766 [Smittium culicis]|uniref:Uncharacterized protein n=1 Tax=Smittium culicis TaxID=133412 RepID=A0A1R1YLH3_9FUNG|nr:hypothetical protein AYI69_g2766 [Smittium culicis]
MAEIRCRFWANQNQFSIDHKKIDFISGHLTGSAMTWFDAIITDNAPATKNYEQKYIPKYDGQGYKPYHNYTSQQYNKRWEISNNQEKTSVIHKTELQ